MVLSRIALSDPNDISFAKAMKGNKCAGATLPSGLKIPKDGDWVFTGTSVINKAAPPSPDDDEADNAGEGFSVASMLEPALAGTSFKAETVAQQLVVVLIAVGAGVSFGGETVKTLFPVIVLALGLADSKWRTFITSTYTEMGKLGPAMLVLVGLMICLSLVPDLEEPEPEVVGVNVGEDGEIITGTAGEAVADAAEAVVDAVVDALTEASEASEQ